ncbi:MAG: chromosome segregation protein SMC, partial [Gammaproteobacteria bacterium]|nr:chromosome segregation protein SMC [Gammaproteobacteria bacterium]
MEKADNPCEALNVELQKNLIEKTKISTALSDTRVKVEDIENTIRNLDKERLRNEHEINDLRSLLEKSRLLYQELLIKQENQLSLVNETDFTLQQLFLQIPNEAAESDWVNSLSELEQKIKNLGNINLAAIDEYNEQSERKLFLDKQNADLLEALETLEKAIAKIDRETRSRFKDTYEKVNSKLQELFPKLFGGGRAYLDLTGEDLLSTGVTIMAQPPGKRNNSIHLLSGGEKAMTAVALVFAIFSLNPAPFCMLDEV